MIVHRRLSALCVAAVVASMCLSPSPVDAADDRTGNHPGKIRALFDGATQQCQITLDLIQNMILGSKLKQGGGVTAGRPGCRGVSRQSQLPRLAGRIGPLLGVAA